MMINVSNKEYVASLPTISLVAHKKSLDFMMNHLEKCDIDLTTLIDNGALLDYIDLELQKRKLIETILN